MERCGDSILNAETWMKKKERHLEYKNIEMERSANEIKETIQRLTDDRWAILKYICDIANVSYFSHLLFLILFIYFYDNWPYLSAL